MKRLLLLLSLAFVASCTREEVEEPLDLKVLQISHDWNAFDSNKNDSEATLEIEVYLKNESDKLCSQNVRFDIELDTTKLDPLVIRELIEKDGIDPIRRYAEERDSPKARAAVTFHDRGMKLPDGEKFEPVIDDDAKPFITTVYNDIELKPNETKKYELKVEVAPSLRGFAPSVDVTDNVTEKK